jgi:amino acid permease
METSGLFEFLLWGLLGMGFIIFGMLIRSGKQKAWFLQKSYPVLAPKAFAFALIPAGIAFLVAAVTALLPDMETRGKAFVYGSMPIFLIALVLAMWQPGWLLPQWYRWLLHEHGDIIRLLEEEARGLGSREEWERRASTQESLEVWVAEVRRKHGL